MRKRRSSWSIAATKQVVALRYWLRGRISDHARLRCVRRPNRHPAWKSKRWRDGNWRVARGRRADLVIGFVHPLDLPLGCRPACHLATKSQDYAKCPPDKIARLRLQTRLRRSIASKNQYGDNPAAQAPGDIAADTAAGADEHFEETNIRDARLHRRSSGRVGKAAPAEYPRLMSVRPNTRRKARPRPSSGLAAIVAAMSPSEPFRGRPSDRFAE